jgi:hypothetical protein
MVMSFPSAEAQTPVMASVDALSAGSVKLVESRRVESSGDARAENALPEVLLEAAPASDNDASAPASAQDTNTAPTPPKSSEKFVDGAFSRISATSLTVAGGRAEIDEGFLFGDLRAPATLGLEENSSPASDSAAAAGIILTLGGFWSIQPEDSPEQKRRQSKW